MFNNRTTDGRNNICGINVAKLRKALKISQRELADRLRSSIWISTRTQFRESSPVRDSSQILR